MVDVLGNILYNIKFNQTMSLETQPQGKTGADEAARRRTQPSGGLEDYLREETWAMPSIGPIYRGMIVRVHENLFLGSPAQQLTHTPLSHDDPLPSKWEANPFSPRYKSRQIPMAWHSESPETRAQRWYIVTDTSIHAGSGKQIFHLMALRSDGKRIWGAPYNQFPLTIERALKQNHHEEPRKYIIKHINLKQLEKQFDTKQLLNLFPDRNPSLTTLSGFVRHEQLNDTIRLLTEVLRKVLHLKQEKPQK